MLFIKILLVLVLQNADTFGEALEKGEAFYSERKIEQAYHAFSRAKEINPDSDVIWFKLALCLEKMNRMDEALEHYGKAIELNPKPLYYNHLGQAVYVQGKTELAIQYYKSALELDPDYVISRFNMGAAYYHAGSTEKGCKLVQEAYDQGFKPAKQILEAYCF